MAYDSLKTAVAQVIRANGQKEITGPVLDGQLNAIIDALANGGYAFQGVATTSTAPGTPDHKVFYIGGAGSYSSTNWSANVTVPRGSIVVFYYDSTWHNSVVRTAGDGFVNVNDINGQSAAYNNVAAARAAVPAGLRKPGLQITYLLASGWMEDQFNGADISGWGTASNWKTTGPVGVSQNTITGNEELHIGDSSLPLVKIDDVIERKYQVVGNGSTALPDIKLNTIPNYEYIIEFGDWDISSIDGRYCFIFAGWKDGNPTIIDRLTSTIDNYSFIADANYDYYTIGLRATNGTSLKFTIKQISDVVRTIIDDESERVKLDEKFEGNAELIFKGQGNIAAPDQKIYLNGTERYIINFHNPNWNVTGVTSTYKCVFCAWKNNNYTLIRRWETTSTIDEIFLFTADPQYDYYTLSIRATSGEIVRIGVQNIEIKKENSVVNIADDFKNWGSNMIYGDYPIFEPKNGFLKDPSVFKHNGKWYMYFTTNAPSTTYDLAWAISDDGINWDFKGIAIAHSGNEQISKAVCASSKAILIGSVWHIWVTQWGNIGWSVGHYTCEDIENPQWIADQNNPIITSSTNHALDPFVILHNDTYYLFYTYGKEYEDDDQIAFVTSSDGVNWSEPTDLDGVNGEGCIVIKTPYKWRIFAAKADVNSATEQDIDSWESDSITGPYTSTGKIKMPLSSWGSVSFGHGDIVTLEAGKDGVAKTTYLMYYQVTWDAGNHFACSVTKSCDLYLFEPIRFGYYGWADFWNIQASSATINQSATVWKRFARRYEYLFKKSVSCDLRLNSGNIGGFILFAEKCQYLNSVQIYLDKTEQKIKVDYTAEDGNTTTTLVDVPFVITDGGIYDVSLIKVGTQCYMYVGDTPIIFNIPDIKFEKTAIALTGDNQVKFTNFRLIGL